MPRIMGIEKMKSTPVDRLCRFGGKLRSDSQLGQLRLGDSRSSSSRCIYTRTGRNHRRARRAHSGVKTRIGKVAHVLDPAIAPDHDVLRCDAKMEGGGKAAIVHDD